MANSFHFNDIDFSGASYGASKVRGLIPWAAPVSAATTPIARGDGAVMAASTFGPRAIEFSVIVEGTSATDLKTKLDAIAVALNERADCVLKFDYISTRYWNARFLGLDASLVNACTAQLALSFVASDPFAYAVTGSTDNSNTITLVAGDTVTVTVGGTAFAYPTLVFTANATITQVVIENDATDDRLEWTGTLASGDALRVNCDPRTLLVEKKPSGGEYAASMSGVEGRHPYFLPNTDTDLIIYGFTGTLDISWRNRFL